MKAYYLGAYHTKCTDLRIVQVGDVDSNEFLQVEPSEDVGTPTYHLPMDLSFCAGRCYDVPESDDSIWSWMYPLGKQVFISLKFPDLERLPDAPVLLDKI